MHAVEHSHKVFANSTNKQYILVIYDIKKDKRRNKFVKIMNSYGERVQYSSFEFLLSTAEQKNLYADIQSFYKAEELDSIRVYRFRGEADVDIYGDIALVSEGIYGLEFI